MKDLYNFLSLQCDYIAAWFNDQAIKFDRKAGNKPGDEHETGYNSAFLADQAPGPPYKRRRKVD